MAFFLFCVIMKLKEKIETKETGSLSAAIIMLRG